MPVWFNWKLAISLFVLVFAGSLLLYVALLPPQHKGNETSLPEEEDSYENPEDLTMVLPSLPSPIITPTLSVLAANTANNNFGIGYDYKPVPQPKGTVRIPVLTFHHIAALPTVSSMKPYYVTPKNFEAMLQYLKLKNYHVITTQEFYDLLVSGKNPTQKTVMLTFDDGAKDNYTNAYPLLLKYGYTGVFYVNTKKLAITPTQLKEMSDHGMVIDSHTASHLDLKKITNYKQLVSEIATSKVVLESITKKRVVSVSYPGCTYNDTVVKVAIAAGYKFGVTCSKYIDHRASARFSISRMHIYNDPTNFKKRLSGMWIIP